MLSKMKQRFFLHLVFLLALVLKKYALSEIIKPVTFDVSVNKKNVKIGDTVELIFTAKILSGYYIYGSNFDENIGPNPTQLNIDKLIGGTLVGKLTCKNCISKYDEVFEATIPKGYNTVYFIQKIKISAEKFIISGSIDGQSCTIEDGICRIFNHEVYFELNTKSQQFQSKIESNNLSTKVNDSTDNANTTQAKQNQKVETFTNGTIETNNKNKKEVKEDSSIWGFILLSFGAGLIALMTPCVYPMLPLTVSIFTKQKNGKKQWLKPLVYSLSIITIYTFLGMLTALLMGPDAANFFSTNWVVNIIFFVIFIIFGLSFLGLFELTLPSSIINKVDAQSDKGGWLGIFFMAFTLVLVSFSCTGPITGSLLVRAANGEIFWPIIGMVSFSTAFALPFGLLAFFPTLLKKLPKSGSWLNTLKVSLGFIELALAFKFLSQADLNADWHFLSRDLFIAIHIAISFALSLYLFGIIKIDEISAPIGVIRLLFALLFLIVSLYLLPGLFGAPLRLFSGYLPPITTQEFSFRSWEENDDSKNVIDYLCDKPKFSDILKPISGFATYFDYKQALECAKKMKKPLFVDFTGKGCANCRKMEEIVFTNNAVKDILKNKFIMVSLYVDFDKELPKQEWYVSTYDNKVKKTIGSQNADLQISKFKNNAQPYYFILDENENLLTKEPYAFDLDVDKFKKFLEEGLNNYYRN